MIWPKKLMHRLRISPAAALLLILFTLTLSTVAPQKHGNPSAFLILGASGTGKSTFTNILVGAPVSAEGPSGNSTTKYPVAYPVIAGGRGEATLFPEGALIIDTPGFDDTDGLSLECLSNLVRAELFRHGLSELSGVLLLVDGAAPRLTVQRSLQQTLTILGGLEALSHVVVVVTKASVPRPDGTSNELLLSHVREALAKAGGLPERVTMIDLKSFQVAGGSSSPATSVGGAEAIVQYLSGILQKWLPGGPNRAGLALSGLEELRLKEEKYLAEGLESEGNWVNRTINQPRLVSRMQTKTVMASVAYNYDCDCHNVCRRRVLGYCVSRRTVCGTCVGTRQEPRQELEEVYETVYDTETVRELINDKEFYRRKAQQRVADELRASVFGSFFPK